MTIPQTPYKKKIEPFDRVVGHLVAYMELAQATFRLLSAEKRLTQAVGIRLTAEISFCQGTLTNVCQVPIEHIQALAEKVRTDAGFKEEVQSMAEFMSPGHSRVLITTEEFKKESGGRLPNTGKFLLGG